MSLLKRFHSRHLGGTTLKHVFAAKSWISQPIGLSTTCPNDSLAGKFAIATIPGTAGELVQGCLESGEDFLVTNPVACLSKVQVIISAKGAGVTIFPPDRMKAQRAVCAALRLLGCAHLG